MEQINKQTIVKRAKDIVFNAIDDEIVMLSIENGEYYGLDAIGSRVWKLIENPVSFEYITSELIQEFNVSESTCIKDVSEFLISLKEKNLIILD